MKNESLKVIGQRVRELREAQNLTVQALSTLAEVEVSNIAAIEDGSENNPITDLYRISKALHVPLSQVVKDV